MRQSASAGASSSGTTFAEEHWKGDKVFLPPRLLSSTYFFGNHPPDTKRTHWEQLRCLFSSVCSLLFPSKHTESRTQRVTL